MPPPFYVKLMLLEINLALTEHEQRDYAGVDVIGSSHGGRGQGGEGVKSLPPSSRVQGP